MAGKKVRLASTKYVWTLKGSKVWTAKWGPIDFDTLRLEMAERMINEGCKFFETKPPKQTPAQIKAAKEAAEAEAKKAAEDAAKKAAEDAAKNPQS